MPTSCPFTEHFLHIIWNEGLLAPTLATADGQPVKILSPGLWNRGAGPDFHDAVLSIGGEEKRGDVEMHRLASDWFRHGHDGDPAYARVILHVVWNLREDAAGRLPTHLATLELSGQLQPGLADVLSEVRYAFYPYASQVPPGACALRWALSNDEALRRILKEAGCARCRRRGQSLAARCAEAPPSQVLYEALFEALGYANNREPFRALAQALPLAEIADAPPEERLALLFGAAGLLPDPTREGVLPEMEAFVQRCWRLWWRSGRTAPAFAWKQHGGRPLNSVHRRLLAGALWLERGGGSPVAWMQQATRGSLSPKEMLKGLLTPLAGDARWRAIRDFSHRLTPPAALLGQERLCDLALNVWLPFAWAEANACGDQTRATRVLECWQLIPRGPGNAVLKAAIHRFLTPPSRADDLLKSAAQQQGLMDIFKTFCLPLGHHCAECPFVTGDRR